MNNSHDDDKTARRIRSFVKRPGRVTPGQRKAFERLLPRYCLDPSSSEVLDLDAVFGRSAARRTLEIGYGDGESLVSLAKSRPDEDFLGMEVHEPGIGHCMLAAESAEISNLRLLADDAITVMTRRLAAASLARINLYFPDPWPKKRHHKRRIVAPYFLGLAHGVLGAGGRLHIATDWAPYAEHIDETMEASPLFRLFERREHDGDQPIDRQTTKFERRGLRLGHRIVDWVFEKIAA